MEPLSKAFFEARLDVLRREKDSLVSQLKAVDDKRAQLLANANAYNGAIEELSRFVALAAEREKQG